MALSLTACGTSTLKSLLSLGPDAPHVHLRLRKRLSRCTLDCGFKTSESPALRGFVGGSQALATAALYLAFFFILEKAVKSIGNVVIPTFPTRWSHGLQHLRHKRRNARFKRLRRVHATPAPNRAHSGLHGETRGVSALCEVDRGMIQQAGGNGCARLQRASASSGVAAPQGCGTFSLITAWSFLHRY